MHRKPTPDQKADNPSITLWPPPTSCRSSFALPSVHKRQASSRRLPQRHRFSLPTAPRLKCPNAYLLRLPRATLIDDVRRQHSETSTKQAARRHGIANRPARGLQGRYCQPRIHAHGQGVGALVGRKGPRDAARRRARAGLQLAASLFPHARAAQDDEARGLAAVRHRAGRVHCRPHVPHVPHLHVRAPVSRAAPRPAQVHEDVPHPRHGGAARRRHHARRRRGQAREEPARGRDHGLPDQDATRGLPGRRVDGRRNARHLARVRGLADAGQPLRTRRGQDGAAAADDGVREARRGPAGPGRVRVRGPQDDAARDARLGRRAAGRAGALLGGRGTRPRRAGRRRRRDERAERAAGRLLQQRGLGLDSAHLICSAFFRGLGGRADGRG